MYELFVKTDCEFCKKAIDLLSLKKIPFIATVVDRCPEYLEKKKELYGWTTVPIILKVEENSSRLVGGFTELESEMNNE